MAKIFSFKTRGSFVNSERFLKKMSEDDIFAVLNGAGQVGVNALAAATPADTGVTASSWDYIVEKNNGQYSITWTNNNVRQGFSIVLGLHYGHGTGTGGWVAGRDFINPTMQPIFDTLVDMVWKEVTEA